MNCAGVVALVSFLLPVLATPAPAARRPEPSTGARARPTAFTLFAFRSAQLNGNRVMLTIGDVGDQGQPGISAYSRNYWPGGTPDRYVWNGGLQVAAIIPGVDAPDFPWPGDTVGAFFFDGRGSQQHGSALTPVFDSRRDLAEWPAAAWVTDPTLFHATLLGRQAASEQDTWVRYWDGDPNLTTGRPHPMGLLVEQRTLAWNDTAGNEDLVSFIYRLISVSAADPARYAGLAALGFSPQDIAEIAQLGRTFRDRMRVDLDVSVPDTGYVFSQMHVGYGQAAPDIADGAGTASTAVIGYQMLYTVDPVCRPTWWGIPCVPLAATAALAPLDLNQDGASDGNGIVMVINGEPFFMQMNVLPASSTQWHLRAVGGQGMTATCSNLPPVRTTELLTALQGCGQYAFMPWQTHRMPLAPGLTYRIHVTQAFEVTAASGDLERIHTVPDPYYVANPLDVGGDQRLRFVNLPDRAIIRIYSVSGILVSMVSHNDPTGGGEAEWDVRNRAGRRVASGVYFYHVTTADGREQLGRFTVVNGAR